MRARRAGTTRSSPAPMTWNSSSRCSRAVLRSSSLVARTVSTSRTNASSTWPPSRSRSATRIWAATSVGAAAAAARAAAGRRRPCAASAAPVPARLASASAGLSSAPARRRRAAPSRSSRSIASNACWCSGGSAGSASSSDLLGRLVESGPGVDPAGDAVLRRPAWSSSSMTGLDLLGRQRAGEQRHRLALDQAERHRDLTAPGTPAGARGWRRRPPRSPGSGPRSRPRATPIDVDELAGLRQLLGPQDHDGRHGHAGVDEVVEVGVRPGLTTASAAPAADGSAAGRPSEDRSTAPRRKAALMGCCVMRPFSLTRQAGRS